ncbi:hypothetical protein MMC25_001794 [Agyrium rufum]|nr:hypothetical protein [Agyrium rufum]
MSRRWILCMTPAVLYISLLFSFSETSYFTGSQVQASPLMVILAQQQIVLAEDTRILNIHLPLLDESLELWNLSGIGERISHMAPNLRCCHHPGLESQFLWKECIQNSFPWWTAAPPATQRVLLGLDDQHDKNFEGEHAEGIVILVSDSSELLQCKDLIRNLRTKLDCDLPIELAYSSALPVSLIEEIQALANNVTDARALNLGNFFLSSMLKSVASPSNLLPFALLANRFSRVVFIRPVTTFLQNPSILLEDLASENASYLFFHDRAIPQKGQYSRRDWIENLFRIGNRHPSQELSTSAFWNSDLREQATGDVVVADKSTLASVLTLAFAAWMNAPEAWEGVIGGHIDSKETLWLAADLMRTPYAFASPSYANIIGVESEHRVSGQKGFTKNICSQQTLQLDLRGKPSWIGGGRDVSRSVQKRLAWMHIVLEKPEAAERLSWEDQGNGFWCVADEGTALEGTELGTAIKKAI